MSLFRQKVYDATGQIPKGYVVTYGEIARYIGSPQACRAVGSALRHNPTPIVVPCHRVVPADLSVGKFFGQYGTQKLELLEAEGVTLKNGKINRKHLFLFSDVPQTNS